MASLHWGLVTVVSAHTVARPFAYCIGCGLVRVCVGSCCSNCGHTARASEQQSALMTTGRASTKLVCSFLLCKVDGAECSSPRRRLRAHPSHCRAPPRPPQVGGHLSSTWLLEGNYACSIVTVPRRAAETARSFEPAFGAESESRGAVSDLLPEF